MPFSLLVSLTTIQINGKLKLIPRSLGEVYLTHEDSNFLNDIPS